MRGLYAIVDPHVCMREPVLVADAILRAGCAALQLRDKISDDATFTRLGHELRRACANAGVPFVVNDRHWLARELRADGVHIGQTDTPIETVRRELGNVSIGVSTHSLAQALDAVARGADLIGFGPVFPTTSKVGADPVVGVDALAEVCRAVNVPVVAIGGITLDRVASVIQSGTTLAAVISAVCAASDPEAAARAFHTQLRA